MITPQPMVRFLDALSWRPGTYRALFVNPKSHPPWLKWFTDRASLLAYFVGDPLRYDVYVSVGPSSVKRGPKKRPLVEDIMFLPALWADIDLYGEAHKAPLPKTVEQAVALLAEAGLPEPSMLVVSGHGLNPYWFLADPWSFETDEERHAAQRTIDGVQQALKAAALQHGWTLDTVSTINTALRLPGSWNYHVKPREHVELIGKSGTRFDREAFAKFAALSSLPEVIPLRTFTALGTPNAIRVREDITAEPKPLPLRIWTAGELMAALTTPEMELYFAHRLGVPVGFNVAHTCTLHPDERNPSGNLTYDPKRLGIYWCNHHEKRGLPDRNYTLPQLYAYRETGLLERLKPGETFVWRVRMAVEFGVLPLPTIQWKELPLPPTDASDRDMGRYGERVAVYEAVKLRYALQALTGEEAVALARRYVARFAGLTRTHGTAHAEKLAEEYIHWLHDMGLIARTRAYKSIKEPALYSPCLGAADVFIPRYPGFSGAEENDENDIPEMHEDRFAEAMASLEQLPGDVR
jgi:hypothetical protein